MFLHEYFSNCLCLADLAAEFEWAIVVLAGDQSESCLHLAFHHEFSKNASRLLCGFGKVSVSVVELMLDSAAFFHQFVQVSLFPEFYSRRFIGEWCGPSPLICYAFFVGAGRA